MALMGLRPPFSCSYPLDPDGRSSSTKKPPSAFLFSTPRQPSSSRGTVSVSQVPPPRCLRFATRFPTRLEFLSFSSSGRRISFSLGRHRLSIPRSRRLPLPIPAGYSILAKQFLRKTLFSNVLKSRRANVGAKRGDLATRISKMQTTYQEANRCVQRRGIERTRNARFVFNGIFLTEKKCDDSATIEDGEGKDAGNNVSYRRRERRGIGN